MRTITVEQSMWISTKSSPYNKSGFVFPFVVILKSRNKSEKQENEKSSRYSRCLATSPRKCLVSIGNQCVACERRRISGRRYTLGWREATKGNMSGFEGYRVIFGSINYFSHPTVSMSSHPECVVDLTLKMIATATLSLVLSRCVAAS